MVRVPCNVRMELCPVSVESNVQAQANRNQRDQERRNPRRDNARHVCPEQAASGEARQMREPRWRSPTTRRECGDRRERKQSRCASDRDDRDARSERWHAQSSGRHHLTRTRSATADEGARRSEWRVEVISKVERRAVRRSLHRLVRSLGRKLIELHLALETTQSLRRIATMLQSLPWRSATHRVEMST